MEKKEANRYIRKADGRERRRGGDRWKGRKLPKTCTPEEEGEEGRDQQTREKESKQKPSETEAGLSHLLLLPCPKHQYKLRGRPHDATQPPPKPARPVEEEV